MNERILPVVFEGGLRLVGSISSFGHMCLLFLAWPRKVCDLPPLKWSSLKYDFRMEDEIDGEEEAYG